MRDYCSMFPENFMGAYIGKCCKKHDNEVGQAGIDNPVLPHINFYKCLTNIGVKPYFSIIIAVGAGIGSFVRYPYFAYRKYKWRKKNDK